MKTYNLKKIIISTHIQPYTEFFNMNHLLIEVNRAFVLHLQYHYVLNLSVMLYEIYWLKALLILECPYQVFE